LARRGQNRSSRFCLFVADNSLADNNGWLKGGDGTASILIIAIGSYCSALARSRQRTRSLFIFGWIVGGI
jgi:hypothetical protein